MKPVAVVAAALCVLLACWSLVHHTSDPRYRITDTGLYEQYGDAVARGAVPYRDFALEYPPAAIPVFVLPSLGHERDRAAYDRWFDREMALCACLALLGVAVALRGAIHAPPALLTVAVAPLLLGPVVLSRFDYWPAALAALALAALVHRRLPLAAVLLGAAVGAKLWPAVLVPPAAVWLARTRGPRAAGAFLGGVAAVVAAIFVPFAALAPAGLGHSFHEQLARPLQLESLVWRGGHPGLHLVRRRQDDRHRLRMDGADDVVCFGREKAEERVLALNRIGLGAPECLFTGSIGPRRRRAADPPRTQTR